MDESDLRACTVRIHDDNGITRGTGFVISKELIATCAHIIENCDKKPGDQVNIVFFAGGEEHSAQVIPEFWRTQEGKTDADDIAILHIPKGIPKNVKIAELGNNFACRSHPIQIFGFPPMEMGHEVLISTGNLKGVLPHPNKNPMLQMDAQPMKEGLSGAPVLDLTTGRIVGIVNEFYRNAPLNWATTTETLQSACSELTLLPPQPIEDYLKALYKYCSTLPYLTLQYIEPNKTLNETYVDAEFSHNIGNGTVIENSTEINPGKPISISDLFSSNRSGLIILGKPGSGKSTLLRHLATCAWEEPKSIGLQGKFLPILISLGQLSATSGSLEERLIKVLSDELALTQALPKGFFSNWPAQTDTKWLILLDAFDDVPSNEQDHFTQWLNSIIDEINANYVLITSRPGRSLKIKFGLFEIFSILPFTHEQIKKFAYSWFNTQSDTFLKKLNKVRAGETKGTPLLLTIAAKVFFETGDIPIRKSKLYEVYIEIILEDRKKVLEKSLSDTTLSIASKYIIANIALYMTQMESQVNDFGLKESTIKFLHDELNKTAIEAKVLSNYIIDIMSQHSGIFIKIGGRYEFLHPTFREYLTAWLIIEKYSKEPEQLWELYISRWGKENWREVILFIFGILSDKSDDREESQSKLIDDLVEEIIKSNGLFISAEILFEQVKVSENVRAQIIEKLFAFAQDPQQNESIRLVASQMLSELGKPDKATEPLLSLVNDKKIKAWIREQALFTLGKFEQTDNLLLLMTKKSSEPWIRFSVIEILANMETPRIEYIRFSNMLRQSLTDNEKYCKADYEIRILRAIRLLIAVSTPLVADSISEVEQKNAIRALGKLCQVRGLAQVIYENIGQLFNPYLSDLIKVLQQQGEILGFIVKNEKIETSERLFAFGLLIKLQRKDIVIELLRDHYIFRLVTHTDLFHWLADDQEYRLLFFNFILDKQEDIEQRVSFLEHYWEYLISEGKAQKNNYFYDIEKTIAFTDDELSATWLAIALEENTSDIIRIKASRYLMALKKSEEASTILLKVVRNKKSEPSTRLSAAQELGMINRSKTTLGKMMLLKDNTIENKIRLQIALELCTETRSADYVKAILDLSNEQTLDSLAVWQIAGILIALGKTDEAIQLFTELVRSHNTIPWMQIRAAGLLGRLGNIDQIISVIKEPGIKYQAVHEIIRNIYKHDLDSTAIQIYSQIALNKQIKPYIRHIVGKFLMEINYVHHGEVICRDLLQDNNIINNHRLKAARLLLHFGKLTDEDISTLLKISNINGVQVMGLWQIANILINTKRCSEVTEILKKVISSQNCIPWVFKRATKLLEKLEHKIV